MQPRFDDPLLPPIAEKVLAGERLGFADGVALYRSGDLLGIGYLANEIREKLSGNTTFFNVNRHINPTNVCVAACKLCAFGRQVRSEKAYTMSLEQVWEVAGQGYSEAVSEFHIVGGLHPELDLDWFCEMIRGLRERYPQVHLKAFTMVEVGYLARRAKVTVEETLIRLKDAGVHSLPGGGAEIFEERVRRIICDHKIDGNEWLSTARTAHQLGLKSNATMLYGHIETEEDTAPVEQSGGLMLMPESSLFAVERFDRGLILPAELDSLGPPDGFAWRAHCWLRRGDHASCPVSGVCGCSVDSMIFVIALRAESVTRGDAALMSASSVYFRES